MPEITGSPTLLYRLNEQTPSVFPSDAQGNLEDLEAQGPNSRPLIQDGALTGFARIFSGSVPTGLEVVDTESNLNLTRSVTVHTIIDWDLASQTSPGVLCALGFRDSSPGEDLQFWVQLEQGSGANVGKITMRWENTAGTLISNAGGEFFVPSAGGPLLLTCVREWRSPTDVVVRYYGNGVFIDRNNSTDGDIGGAAGATFLMGVAGDGAGGYTNYLEGTVDQLAVYDFAMTAEEIRQIYRRVALHPTQQYESIKSLLPKDVWSLDPSSTVQRELFVEAQLYAQVASKIAEMREDFLPDRAWSFLERWETVLGLLPNPHDTLATRRNRLLSALRTVEGYSIQGVQNALAAAFELESTQVQVCENSHTLTETFLSASGVPDTMFQVPGNGAIAVNVSDRLEMTNSGLDADWHTDGTTYVQVEIDRDEDAADPSLGAQVNVAIREGGGTGLSQTVAAIMFMNKVDNTALVVGVTEEPGARTLVRYEFDTSSDNGATAITVLDAAFPLGAFVDVKYIGSGQFEISRGGTTLATRDDLTLLETHTTTLLTEPSSMLLALIEHPTELAAGASDAGEFEDFRLYTPNGLGVYTWYAYRDPLLTGDADIPGAQVIIDRIKPAHTRGFATQTKALLCDDEFSLCDEGPLGG